MKPDELLQLFEGLHLFEELTDEEKKSLVDLETVIVKYSHNENIIKQGDIDLRLFVLLKGNVRVTRNENPEIVITDMIRGDVFGEVSFLSNSPRTANVISDGESIILTMDGELFEELSVDVQNKIRARLIDLLVKRLDSMTKTILPYLRFH